MSEMIIFGKDGSESPESSHIRGIQHLSAFLQEPRNRYLPIFADVTFEYSNKFYHHVGRIIAIQYESLILSDNPLYGFDSELCFSYEKPNKRWWLNPVIEEQFPPGTYADYIDTYSSMDVINKIFVRPIGVSNAELKEVLTTKLD